MDTNSLSHTTTEELLNVDIQAFNRNYEPLISILEKTVL